MKYRISKFSGWFLLAASLWLVICNYSNYKVYIVLAYCCAWLFLTSNRGDIFRYQKDFLLCIQSGAISLLGYRVIKRWLFVFENQSIGGIHDEGSPLSFLIGSAIEIIVLCVLIFALIEVVKKQQKRTME
jgi:hypothetical protein